MSETEAGPRARDGWLIAAALLVFYCALGQGTFYKVDGQVLLWTSQDGSLVHPYHTFYLPGLAALKPVGAALGLTLFETATVYSALGTALAMALAHAAMRSLRLSRAACNAGTALLGLTPGVVFFATVVEVHGPFLVFAGLAFLATARLLRAGDLRGPLLLGPFLGLAYLAHPTGALMVFLLPAVGAVAAQTSRSPEPFPLRRCVRFTAIAGASMAAFMMIVPRILSAVLGTRADPSGALSLALAYPGEALFAPRRTLEILAEEWLLPFFPATALALAAALTPRRRAPLGWLLAALVPYALGAQLMLKDYSERGAYLLPAAMPTVLIALGVLDRHRRLVAPALVLAAALAAAQVVQHDDAERPRSFARGLQELSGDRPFFLLVAGHPLDVEAQLVCFEDRSRRPAWLGYWIGEDEDQLANHLRVNDAVFGALRKSGFEVFVSERTWAGLLYAAQHGRWMASDDPVLWMPGPAAAAIVRHFEQRYRLEPVRAAGFEGYRLAVKG